MDIEKCIDRIVSNGISEDMHKLNDILIDLLEFVEDYDEKTYKKYEMAIYEIAYGKKLTREMAESVVNKMKPYGMRWSFEESRQLMQEYGVNDVDEIDFFVVINSAFNDYRDLFNDNIDMYIKFAIDFIRDEDAKDGKVFIYFTQIGG
jgi:hydrogenase maturation factor HypE